MNGVGIREVFSWLGKRDQYTMSCDRSRIGKDKKFLTR